MNKIIILIGCILLPIIVICTSCSTTTTTKNTTVSVTSTVTETLMINSTATEKTTLTATTTFLNTLTTTLTNNVNSTATTSVTTTASVNTPIYTVITTVPMSNQGNIQISDGITSNSFQYMEWSTTTPATFTFLDVTFSFWSVESGITTPGISLYGPAKGHLNGGYNITFAGGSTEKMSLILVGFKPHSQLKLTEHVNPQAGLFINTTTGTVYFLVSH
jgi:hypothetical protein